MYPGTLDPTKGTNFEFPNPPANKFAVYNIELTTLALSVQNVKNLSPFVIKSTR